MAFVFRMHRRQLYTVSYVASAAARAILQCSGGRGLEPLIQTLHYALIILVARQCHRYIAWNVDVPICCTGLATALQA